MKEQLNNSLFYKRLQTEPTVFEPSDQTAILVGLL